MKINLFMKTCGTCIHFCECINGSNSIIADPVLAEDDLAFLEEIPAWEKYEGEKGDETNKCTCM
jgi:hypothetical protein